MGKNRLSPGGWPPTARSGMLSEGGCSRVVVRGLATAMLLWAFRAHCELPTVTNEWLVKIGCASDSSAAIGPDGTIYFGTWEGKLWALDPKGKRKWTFETGVEIRSSPAVGADGTIYVGCSDRELYGV